MDIRSLEQSFRSSNHIMEDVMTCQELECLIKNEGDGALVFGVTKVTPQLAESGVN